MRKADIMRPTVDIKPQRFSLAGGGWQVPALILAGAVVFGLLVRMSSSTPSFSTSLEAPVAGVSAEPSPVPPSLASLPTSPGQKQLVEAARAQIGRTLRYVPAYVALSYPGGDVPIEQGVCTDVVIRAMREGLGVDLQRVVHEDMRANFSAYPKMWGLKRPDRNIDHRRVPNLQKYFERQGLALPISERGKNPQPGDLLTCTVPPHLPHIMIVSDRVNALGEPLVIHNIGGGTQEEDRLREFPLTGHYRLKYPVAAPPSKPAARKP